MTPATHVTHRRRGFTLLEVMVALGILMVSLTILVETQSTAGIMTIEAERIITATDLANAKVGEALLLVEEEGFTTNDIYEEGEFDELGDDALDLEFGDTLDDYHWEYWISEIDLGLAGDIAEMAGELDGTGYYGGAGGQEQAQAEAAEEASGLSGGLAGLPLTSEAITEMIGPYIREVRVRVWWGEDSDLAEERGDEVIVTSHVINPTGLLSMAPEEMTQQ